MVPSLAVATPEPARGAEVAVSGGQTLAQPPEQWLMRGVSASKRYSERPRGSTRIDPSEDRARRIVAPPPVDRAGAYPVGVAAEGLDPPPDAATTITRPR